jgi:hypothetical protein
MSIAVLAVSGGSWLLSRTAMITATKPNFNRTLYRIITETPATTGEDANMKKVLSRRQEMTTGE